MKRRSLLASTATIVGSLTAGCSQWGIFAGSGGTADGDVVELPDLSGGDRSPADAVTKLQVAWNAVGAKRFDVDPNDAQETTAPPGNIYVVLGYSVVNVGEAAVPFDPGWFSINTDERAYAPEALTHLTPYYEFPINPGDRRGGWVAFLIPEATPRATIRIARWDPDRPFGVAFERDQSVSLPF